jgi:dephospho-CoA kinase
MSVDIQKNKPFRIGIIGGVCSGKSLVAALFQKRGVEVYDGDAIARDIVRPDSETHTLQKIVAYFGDNILKKDGTLDRRLLRDIIFSDPSQRHALEDIMHPTILDRLRSLAEHAKGPYVILELPAFKPKYASLFDRILVVDCPEELQIKRVMARDGCTQDAAQKILESQLTREEHLHLAADHILNNEGKTVLNVYVEKLDHAYRALSQHPSQEPDAMVFPEIET